MAVCLPEGRQSFTTNAGLPLVGGKLYTYQPGTSTPKATYTDQTGSTPNTNPVIANARGEMAVYWSGPYDVTLKDASDNLIWGPERVVTPEDAGAAAALQASLAASGGSAMVGFLQSGTGAVARTAQDKVRETLSVTDMMSTAQRTDYLTSAQTLDLTTACQAAIDEAASSKRTLYWPPGVALVNNLTLQSDLVMNGEAMYPAIIKRKASATGNNFLSASSKSRIVIRGLEIDGNKASQSNAAHNLNFDACEQITVEHCRIKNAKASGGYGAGIAFSDGSNDTSVQQSRIAWNTIESCDDAAVYINKDSFIAVEDNLLKSNGDSGVTVINYVFPPVQYVQNYLLVRGNRCISNTVAGIRFVGFYTGGTSPAPIAGYTAPPNKHVVISQNICKSNGQYGIAYQGFGGSIVGNTCELNGTTTSHGGILCNAWGVAIVGNIVHDNAFYGIDMGGAASCLIDGNFVGYQGATSGLGATGINVGATLDCIVSNNTLENNGGSGRASIYASGYEFGGSYFDQIGARLSICGNKIKLGNADALGIYINHGFDKVLLRGNDVSGGNANKAFVLEGGLNNFFLKERDNIDWSQGDTVPTIASASVPIIPDVGDEFYISGTTNIAGIRTFSQNSYDQKVRFVQITAGGSGYNPASPPTVSFTGGGGAGAAGAALVSNSGAIIGVAMTNFGSGYTSAPTVGFSSGAATAVARVGCDNFAGRIIRLQFFGTLTVTDGANLILAGNLSAVNNTVLTLRGAFGNWYEVSRSIN